MTPTATATCTVTACARAAAAAEIVVGDCDCSGAGSQGCVDDDFNEVFDFSRDNLGVRGVAEVQHNATLNADESATAIAAYLKVTPAQFKAAWRALAGSLKRNAKLGNQSTVDGAFRVANMVKGWFQPLSSPWDKSRNFLHRHLLTRNRSRDAIRELDGFLTDSRRTSSPCVRGTFRSCDYP